MVAKRDRVKLVLASLIGLCLFLLYIGFIIFLGAAILAFPMTPIESLIFDTLIIRVLAIAFIPYLSRAHAQVKIALFSIETFVLVFLILAFILTQQQVYDTLIGQVLTAWVGA